MFRIARSKLKLNFRRCQSYNFCSSSLNDNYNVALSKVNDKDPSESVDIDNATNYKSLERRSEKETRVFVC